MKRTIEVFMGDEARLLGTLHYDAVGTRERSAFAYDETWLVAADRFALEPGLPLVAGPRAGVVAAWRRLWSLRSVRSLRTVPLVSQITRSRTPAATSARTPAFTASRKKFSENSLKPCPARRARCKL